MIDVDLNTGYFELPLNMGDSVLEGKTVDATVEVRLYEVELAARSGATW